MIENMNERRMGERKEVRKEEGVAHFEFWIKSLLQ
jgi:hypothetical protein